MAIQVTHIINSLSTGGGERFLINLLRGLSTQREVRSRVLCLHDEGAWANEVKELGVPLRALNLQGSSLIKMFSRVTAELRANPADIAHTHLLLGCWVGLPAARAARFPHRIAHLQNTHPTLSWRSRLLDRAMFSFADTAFACSNAVASYYVEKMHYPRERIRVVYNAADSTLFHRDHDRELVRTAMGLRPNDFVITCPASLTQQKGHEFLLEAATRLRGEIPGLRVLLAGEGPLRTSITATIERQGLGDHVRLLGRWGDMAGLYAASDLIVLPSRWEGQSLALVEAGMAGRPAVAARVGGVPEVIEDGKTGTLVPSGDATALANALIDLANDEPRRLSMGVRARESTVRRFSLATAAETVLNTYRELYFAEGRRQ